MTTTPERSAPEEELQQLREAVLDDWLVVTSSVTDYLRDIQQTFSWRVTRPLRRARQFQKKVDEVGVVPASQLAAVALAKKLGR
ncbi:hypothetical protein [Frondihabitans australicus]|uniref:Uncharacterized protein n=1 Tax=Frondihabitans australicus TaxID=386892 RepID=A0A495IE08_9MICO|nr:hypothetical protein [Frondihabitans australicus]RKR73246.1 hypothetical protein C8E83_0336 [Frondihabitans australicus]